MTFLDPRNFEYLRVLKKRGFAPKNIQFVRHENYHFVTMFDDVSDNIIHEDVATGFSKQLSVAYLKATSEYIERKVFRFAKKSKIEVAQTRRSDGFAAMPVHFSFAKEMARINAYLEAFERYVWASWWDDTSIEYSLQRLEPACLNLRDLSELEGIVEIKPKTTKQHAECVIWIGILKNKGVISAGAAGLVSRKNETRERIRSEFLRHYLAAKRMNEAMPDTFYQRRLHFFSSGLGDELVAKRLFYHGHRRIQLPGFMFDESIEHPYSDLVYVHRCLFLNQPPFMDGDLNRLCI